MRWRGDGHENGAETIETCCRGSSAVLLPGVALVASVLLVVGCSGDSGPSSPTSPTSPLNQGPRTLSSIPNQELHIGGDAAVVDVAPYFSDPAGDMLTYAATSSSADTVTAAVSGSILTLAPVGVGMATVTVTARDLGGLQAMLPVDVTVVEGPDARITEMSLAVDSTRPDGSGGSLVVGTGIDEARLRVAEELVLSARVRCDDGKVYTAGRFDAPCFTETDPVAWRSSDTSVATVSLGYSDVFAHNSAGVVRSVGVGRATVTATFKGHSASLSLEVVSGASVTDRATMDRPDDLSGAQIHFVYAFPEDAEEDRNYDQAGDLAFIADQMQEWLQAEAGMTWRLDTYNGRLDVSSLPIRWQGAQTPSEVINEFRDALEEREGRLNREKKYAIFFDYDGAQGAFPVEGVASDMLAVTLVSGPLHQHIAGTAIHEVIHTFGAVASCAPNATAGMHVGDSRVDIMGGGGIIGGALDWGRDDYFRHDNAGCLDVADTPYWEGATGGAARTATSDARAVRSRWSIRLRCGGLVR